MRLTVWSVPGLIFGSVGYGVLNAEPGRSVLGMHAAWCLINLAIALPGLIRPKPIDSLPKLREFLMLNLGLNCGYIGVGTAMVLLGSPPVVGAGYGVAVNGIVLLILDGVLMKRLPLE